MQGPGGVAAQGRMAAVGMVSNPVPEDRARWANPAASRAPEFQSRYLAGLEGRRPWAGRSEGRRPRWAWTAPSVGSHCPTPGPGRGLAAGQLRAGRRGDPRLLPCQSFRTAFNDARRIAEVLESHHGYKSPRLLAEGDASLARLRRLFAEELPAAVGPVDRVMVDFAGHGIALDGDDGPAGYLVPQDARRDDRASFLPMTELSACLDALPCRHLLLVLDCCFAGAFRWSNTRDMGAPPEVMYRERFDRFVRDPAWEVLTSAAHDRNALDVLSGETIGVRGRDADAEGLSPFAAAFLRALAGEADVKRGRQSAGAGVIN